MKLKLLLSLILCCLALPMIAGTDISGTINVGGADRSYIGYVPSDLGQNRPLLIFCHGMNQDANWIRNSEFRDSDRPERNINIEAVCDTAKFVVVFPNGIDKSWDIYGDRDINFVKAIIDKMAADHKIDRKRVYLGGFSMGGMLTYHAMNRIPDLIAAFCPVSGYPMGGATADSNVRPIPILHIHGTSDGTCAFSGVQPALDVWINHNGCPTEAKVANNYNGFSGAKMHTWGPGNNSVEVKLLELPNKGHWVCKEPEVYTGKEIWNFCKRYSTAGLVSDGPLPALHVEGKWLVNESGKQMTLHGVMDTPSVWFNDGRWGLSYDDAGRQRCLNYFEKIFSGLQRANCDVFRLHLEPAWTNDNNYTYDKAVSQPADEAKGEADIRHFNPERLKTYLQSLYIPLMQKAMKHGMYVVVRPPGVCPEHLKVGDYYQDYLLEVWDIVSKDATIQQYAGQISLELANEPVSLKNANNQDDLKALHDYFQPIVDKIRSNGFTGIIWIPGTGWQSNYTSYKTNPITGSNIGYAVHDYTGWYGCSDDNPDPQNKINNFRKQVPVVDTNPIIITEVDWSPEQEPRVVDHYNEHGQPVYKNLGTWSTGTTSKWGKAYKSMLDYFGNISMTLSGTACLIDIDELINNNKVTAAFGGNPEACGQTCMEWYAKYYAKNWPTGVKIIETKTPIKLTGTVGNVTIVPYGDSTMDELYAATFTPTADLQNMFQYLNMEVGNHDYIVIKFAEPAPEGWNVHAYGERMTFTDIKGLTEFRIPLDGSPVQDFTLFNWSGCRSSITVTECYFVDETIVQTKKVPVGFDSQVTSLDEILNGECFIIGDDTRLLYFSSDQNSKNTQITNVLDDTYYWYSLEKVTDASVSGSNIYRVRIQNEDGIDYNKGVAGGYYLNTPNSGWSISFAGVSAKNGSVYGTPMVYGTDAENLGLWYITDEGDGLFSFQNVGKANNGEGWPAWLTVENLSSNKAYVKLYKGIDYEVVEVEEFTKEENEADDQIFALSKMENNGWTFDEPVDLTAWDYLVITTSDSPSDGSREIAITDANGKTVHGEDYDGAGTGGKMWLDRWNNQNAIRISLDFLRENKGLDVKHIKSLTISVPEQGPAKLSAVCLTDYNNTNIKGGYCGGDVVREYSVSGSYGTICLPYRAVCAGAEVYSIAGLTTGGIALERVTGMMEAGTPYIYMSADEHGQNNNKTVCNVNFFRIDLAKTDVTAPVGNNGLVGTFTDMTVPKGDNYYVLKSNKLYYTTGATVSLGANKAYVDKSKVQDVAAGRVVLGFGDDATGIREIGNGEFQDNVFDLQGRRQTAQPLKGVYIVNGKKVIK